MSYILDAVARARKRAPHPARAVSRPPLSMRSMRSMWRRGSIVALGALAAALFVAWLDGQRTPRVTAAAPAASAASQVPAAVAKLDVPSMAPRPSRRASAPAAPAAAASATVVAVSKTVVRFSPPTTLSQPLPTPTPLGPGGAYAMAKSPPAVTVATPPAALEQARPRALADLKSLSALPPDLRAAFARMKVRVLFYAPQRRSRFVLIDSRELREGDELFDGLRLEEITDTGLVIRHNDILVLAPTLAAR